MSQIELNDIFAVDREGHPTIKIVLFGPSLAGKTSMLTVFNALRRMENPDLIVSSLTKIQDESGRTVFFDQGCFQTPPFQGKKFDRLRYQLWTIPGEERHKIQRDVVLKGADAVLLVLDFSKSAWDSNVRTVKEVKELVGEKFATKIPVISFINKADLSSTERTDKRAFITMLEEKKAIPSENVANYVMTGSCLDARNDLIQILNNENRDQILVDGRLPITNRPPSVQNIVKPIQRLTQLVVEQRIKLIQESKSNS